MKKLFVIIAMVAFISMGATALAESSGDFEGSSDFESTIIVSGFEDTNFPENIIVDLYDVTIAGGYIYDDVTGDGIPGADVTIRCVETGKTMTDTTDPEGYYLVTIQCGTGDTIEVTATADGKSGSNSGIVEHLGNITMGETVIDLNISRVDVTIPEFPVTALPALLSMFSFGLVRKRLF